MDQRAIHRALYLVYEESFHGLENRRFHFADFTLRREVDFFSFILYLGGLATKWLAWNSLHPIYELLHKLQDKQTNKGVIAVCGRNA